MIQAMSSVIGIHSFSAGIDRSWNGAAISQARFGPVLATKEQIDFLVSNTRAKRVNKSEQLSASQASGG